VRGLCLPFLGIDQKGLTASDWRIPGLWTFAAAVFQMIRNRLAGVGESSDGSRAVGIVGDPVQMFRARVAFAIDVFLPHIA
jgi:hypothetical protein